MTALLTYADGSSSVVRARVQIPAWGRWWCDLDLEGDLSIAAGTSVNVLLGGIELVGATVSGGSAYGRSAYRIVAGTDGWSSEVAAESYQDDAGVPIKVLVQDVASLVGETVQSLPTTRVGQHYARRSGYAIETLNRVAPRAWYVGFDGITRIGARDASTVANTDVITERLLADTAIRIETSALTPYVPGCTVGSFGPAVDVEYALDASRLSVTLFSGPRSSRELDAFRRILDAIDPLRGYRNPIEYRVVTQDGNVLNLQPVRVSAGMPDLARVPVRLGPGQSATHTLGSLVLVVFVDGDPSRPCVIAGDDADAPGWSPTKHVIDGTTIAISGTTIEIDGTTIDIDGTTIAIDGTTIELDGTTLALGASASQVNLGATPRLGVARIGDAVQAGPYTGVITGGSTSVLAGS